MGKSVSGGGTEIISPADQDQRSGAVFLSGFQDADAAFILGRFCHETIDRSVQGKQGCDRLKANGFFRATNGTRRETENPAGVA